MMIVINYRAHWMVITLFPKILFSIAPWHNDGSLGWTCPQNEISSIEPMSDEDKCLTLSGLEGNNIEI